MSQQNFEDESNWKHEPHAKHYEGKDTGPRNWKNKPYEAIEAVDSENENVDQDDETPSQPPGAPDRTPVEEPDEKQKPLGDSQPPSKKKKRL